MIWFIIAAMINTTNSTVDFKINNQIIFNTETECTEYLSTYDRYIRAGLARSFPNLVLSDVRCIDNVSAQQMLNTMRKRREEN